MTHIKESPVGKVGHFKDWKGVEYQCVVTGTDVPPWDDCSLIIDYVRDGRKITGAMIPCGDFIPDES